MANFRVFKTSYTDRKGKARKAAKWYVEFRDQLDTVRRLPTFVSKAAAEEFGRNVVKLVDYHKGSGGQTDPTLTRWLAGLPQKTRDKLVSIGLLDAQRVAVAKPLVDHLEDWRAVLTAKGNGAQHIAETTGRVQRIIDGCAFKYHADISASKLLSFLHELRTNPDHPRGGISATTFNHMLGSFKAFCRWLVKDRRAAESPVAHLDGLNAQTDKRHERRPFTDEELMRLLDAAHHGPERRRMSGPERALLYWLAVESGLRANELRSLNRQSFDLDAEPATVTLEAGYAKNRREDTLPLRPELAAALRSFLATKAPAAPVFRLPSREKIIHMFRADLDAAGIPYVDEAGLFADFHSLRHTFITNLARGGVHPKTAQTLARHSTITLTMDRYTHTLVGEQTEALAALPDLTRPAPATVRSTGTDPVSPTSPDGQTVLADCLALSGRFQGTPVDSGRPLTEGDSRDAQRENPSISAVFRGNTGVSDERPLPDLNRGMTDLQSVAFPLG